MSELPVDNKRRNILFTAVAAIMAMPFFKHLIARPARAELQHLSEDDPAAKALHYKQDATKAERTDKAGVPAQEQFCHNCTFIQSDSGDWRPCQIFPGKAVNANGWCLSWMKQS
jgi:hypothetical protein